MSYCVNCGVELDKSADKCVLCGTKVYNPDEKRGDDIIKPYPVDRKRVELIYYRVTSIIVTTILMLINIICFATNLYIDFGIKWSLIVFGSTLVLWTIINPYLLYPELSSVLYVLIQTASISFCLFLISVLTKNGDWLMFFALPVVISISMHILVGIFIKHRFKLHIIGTWSVVFALLGTFTLSLEFFINLFFFADIFISWSLIASVCCVSVMALLIIISRSKAFKEEAKKRLRM